MLRPPLLRGEDLSAASRNQGSGWALVLNMNRPGSRIQVKKTVNLCRGRRVSIGELP